MIITEILLGSRSFITASTVSLINPSFGIVLTSSRALLSSIAILITNEYISKVKIRFTKLRDWNNVITLLSEKTLKQSMRENKLMEKKHRNQNKFIIITL